ncbi:hypothetical protein [Halorubellus sp. PRR65]|uniref:hypothetical protein n=1 Tax=Halorubellus sp. PRR65 TaxID=3098148 RepID=UPI002B25E070|nr:hypothetical protein [Halorubellus sp. PRR65]
MSTEANTASVERLNNIKRQLERMVERKWTPLREKHDSEPMEVRTDRETIRVGHVNKLWSSLLGADVIRTFDSGYYDFWSGTTVSVQPISASEFYEAPEGMNVRRAAAIRAVDDTGIHVPVISDSGNAVRLKYFETEEGAQRAAAVLKDPIETTYEEMWNGGVEELEVREVEEPREWLAPDSWYSVLVHYE